MSPEESADLPGPATGQAAETPQEQSSPPGRPAPRNASGTGEAGAPDGSASPEGEVPASMGDISGPGEGVLVERSVYEALPDGSHRLTRVIVRSDQVPSAPSADSGLPGADPVPAAVEYPGDSDHPAPVG